MTSPPGGPIPSLNVTLLFMNVELSSSTFEPDIGAMKSSGLRHLSIMTSQTSSMVRRGEAFGGLIGQV